MTPLRQRMIEDMQMRNLAPNTQIAYVRAVAGLAQYLGKSPDQAGPEDVRRYLLHLVREQRVGWSTYKVSRCGLKFFFGTTLDREQALDHVPCAREPRRLPQALSQEEIRRFLAVIRNVKHKALFMTAYGTGLRAAELVELRVEDIDSAAMLIRVREGKGRKERHVKLSPLLLKVLRDYYQARRPQGWLFPGTRPGKPMTAATVTKLARAICGRAGLSKRITTHIFRHTYATHMLDAGADLRTIQVLLGHRNIKSTAIYLHVSKAKIDAAPNPLDLLYPKKPQEPEAQP